jgi:hypothetical protein
MISGFPLLHRFRCAHRQGKQAARPGPEAGTFAK